MMKTVMLLGDSIRMFYQEEVIKNLGGSYRVFSPKENCRFARYTLNSLRYWFDECPTPDIIHWNNGLWDIAVLYEEDGCFTPLDEYCRDMKRILRELKKKGSKILFATTTPVNPLKSLHPVSKHYNDDIIRYNASIVGALKGDVDGIDDLFNVVYPHIGEYIREDYIHPTDAGIAALGKAVAGSITAIS